VRMPTTNVSVVAVPGGIVAPDGFRAAGVASGIKKTQARDLALIVADSVASAAGLFTTNKAVAAPVLVCKEHLAKSKGQALAIVVNSGCANACTGPDGLAVSRQIAAYVASVVRCTPEQVLVASTGVIGVLLDLETVCQGASAAACALGREHHLDAARAIMTTDRAPKEAAVRVTTPAGVFHVGGMAKGAGMIEPNMATMLAFITTDAAVEPALLKRALGEIVAETFNAITIDGDTSTNDSVIALAGGASGVTVDEILYPALIEGFRAVCGPLARAIVKGGEGVTKLVSITVSGASTDDDARRAAKVVANSLLVKTAIHGGDPNWGRLVAAAGRAGVPFELDHAYVRVGPTVLFSDGMPFDDRAPEAATYLEGEELEIEVGLGTGGTGRACVLTSDLSAEYVRINAEYRT
jgi:glutamate N-acetyltransferase / amino-acid N-acetyltransferase